MKSKKKKEEEAKVVTKSTPGEVLPSDVMFEQASSGHYMVYDKKDGKFIVPRDEGDPWTAWEDEDTDTVYFPLERLPWKPAPCAYNYESEETLFNDIRQFFVNHLDVAPDVLYDVYAAFVMASWRPEDFNVVPYQMFLGPLASGKTRGLELFAQLCYRGILATSMSTASLFRALEAWHPTVILDETEIYHRESMVEILALLNAGYRRGQYAWRVEKVGNGKLTLKAFDVFGFKALAGTAPLRNTLQSRCIISSMSKNVRPINLFIDEEKANSLRGNLLMYRFKKLGDPFPKIDFTEYRDCRVAELFVALLSVAPTEEIREKLREYAHVLVKSREEEDLSSLEARIFDAVLRCEDLVEAGKFSTRLVTDKFNEFLPEKEHVTIRSVGRRLRALGFERTRMTGGAAGYFWNKNLVDRLKLRYCPTPRETSLTSLTSLEPSMDVQHESEVSEVSDVFPEGADVQEAIEYAIGMMVKRLPDRTAEDGFLHDLKFKGNLSDEEAEKILDKLTDEGPIGYDADGWLVKI